MGKLPKGFRRYYSSPLLIHEQFGCIKEVMPIACGNKVDPVYETLRFGTSLAQKTKKGSTGTHLDVLQFKYLKSVSDFHAITDIAMSACFPLSPLPLPSCCLVPRSVMCLFHCIAHFSFLLSSPLLQTSDLAEVPEEGDSPGSILDINRKRSNSVFTYSVNGTSDFRDEQKKINSILQVTFYSKL
ncbi:hypothetical protein JD844_002691 [Phrynosoma platyrhinos]|uniref:Uncharacterized protein n=1 Tax=Phrynosoma platyrhinos TaxID=52577 RepID=A0ABQ7TBU9_PHRPL|nr:hypothetical protein JD844_002691 [Phrynosoma platyrhinos]